MRNIINLFTNFAAEMCIPYTKLMKFKIQEYMKKIFFAVIAMCMSVCGWAQGNVAGQVAGKTVAKVVEKAVDKATDHIDDLTLGFWVGPTNSAFENMDSNRDHLPFDVTSHSVSVGGMASLSKEFTHIWGYRGTLGFYGNKGRANDWYKDVYNDYSFQSTELFADMTFDFTDCVNPFNSGKFNLKVFAGVGGAYSFGFPSKNHFEGTADPTNYVDDVDNSFHYGMRAGLTAAWKLKGGLKIGAQYVFNLFDDRFNGIKANWVFDCRQDLQVGLTYTFPIAKSIIKAVIPTPEPVAQPEPTPAPAPVVVPAPQPAKEEPFKLTQSMIDELTVVLHFAIRESDVLDKHKEKVEKLVNFVREHKTTKITVKGYADKGTGNAKLNIGYSKNRSDKTTAELIKKYNLRPDQIEATYYGDTVQPFAENDLNRCAILSVKEIE